MKKTIIGVLAGLVLLSISAVAQAALSDNLIQNGGFTSTTIIDDASNNIGTRNHPAYISLQSGQWYGSGNDWDGQSSGGNPGAYAFLGEDHTQYLFQAVQVSQVVSGSTATAGPVSISLDYRSSDINTGSTYARLYGNDSQPTYSSFGTQLGSLTGFASDKSSWTNKSSSFTAATKGYAWYTVVIKGSTDDDDSYFKVDNVSLRATSQPTAAPVPAAVWLLGSGLIGLAVLRRRTKA
jgi:hypothetical protein